jgi:poly-gamma-glutamate capsule biosynthesis protein CapA/YwtB (metallophosphatase superfamily)
LTATTGESAVALKLGSKGAIVGVENRELLLGFVGDVLIDREDPNEVFSDVGKMLSEVDILFANLESPYSDSPEMALTAPLMLAPRMHNLNAYARAGFDVMSMANNHIVDAGHAAMLGTRSCLRRQGIVTCGAGENLVDASRPAVLEREGVKVGFLGYSSVFPHGYQARSTVPGLAPLRAYNHFHEGEYYAPGYLPRIETIPDPGDHQRLEGDIAALRQEVNLVVTSLHWGDHLRPFVLTDHERRTARLCIDRGADLVLGHHHHSLRGIEWYKGKPIFYGLGHFVFDFRLLITNELKAYFEEVDPESHAIFPREGWPLLPMHPDTRLTLLGWAQMAGDRVTQVGFVPCRLRPDGRVVPVSPDSSEGMEVLAYVNRCNTSQKLNGRLLSDGAPRVGGHPSIRVVPLE